MTEPYEQTSATADGGVVTPRRTIDADGDGRPDYTPDPAGDARSRALRTLAQGALVAAVLAVGTVVTQTIGAARTWADVDWSALSLLAVQAGLTALASYVGRYLSPPR